VRRQIVETEEKINTAGRGGDIQGNRQTKGDISMCYNCGCGMPNNDMDNPANITTETFEEAAKTMKQSAEDAKKMPVNYSTK